MLGFS